MELDKRVIREIGDMGIRLEEVAAALRTLTIPKSGKAGSSTDVPEEFWK